MCFCMWTHHRYSFWGTLLPQAFWLSYGDCFLKWYGIGFGHKVCRSNRNFLFGCRSREREDICCISYRMYLPQSLHHVVYSPYPTTYKLHCLIPHPHLFLQSFYIFSHRVLVISPLILYQFLLCEHKVLQVEALFTKSDTNLYQFSVLNKHEKLYGSSYFLA